MGMERVIELMREVGQVPKASQTDVYVLHHGGESQAKAMLLAETMRDRGIRVVTHPGEASIKSQMKKADASGAEFAVLPPRMNSLRARSASRRCVRTSMRPLPNKRW